MNDFLQLCFAGLALGSRYALVALGFVIIFKATGVINFAQGALVTLGAYMAYNAHQTWGVPFPLALAIAVAVGVVAGIFVQRLLLRRMIGRPVFGVIMITIGLLFLLDQVPPSIWGYDALDLGDPWGIDTMDANGVVLAVRDLWTIGLAATVLFGFFVFFKFSRMGIAMRAAAVDQEAALARGISVRRVFAWSWGIAAGVAALAGVSLGSGPASVTPSLGMIALAAFPAMILGGLDSPKGAVVGGLVIGVTQTLTAGYQPQYAAFLGNNFYVVMPYVVMIAILLVRPYGLFGTKEVHRL
jgi:branched-chain amino acid transport system permease protein